MQDGVRSTQATERDAAATERASFPAARLLENASRWLTMLVVIASPLVLGGNRPLLWSAAAAVLGLALALLGTSLLMGRPLDRRLLLPAAGFGIVVGWMLIQASPLTPSHLHYWTWSAASEILDGELGGAISASPAGTLDSVLRWCSFGCVFMVLAQTCGDAATARRTLAVWLSVGAVLGLASIVAFLSAPVLVGEARKWAYFDLVTGPFVNPNTFATFIGLVAIVGLAALLTFRSEALMSAGALAGGARRVDSELRSRLFYGSVTGVAALALLMTGSRAGIAASLCGAVTILLVYSTRGRRSTNAGLVAAGLVIVFVAGLAALLAEVLSGGGGGGAQGDLEFRLVLYRSTLDAIAARPLLGLGAGAYPQVFPEYLLGDINLSQFRQAHNTYLELMAELGLPVALAWLAVLAWITATILRGVVQRRRFGIPLAALGATVLVGLHSLLDFSAQVPAVALPFAAILGIGYAGAIRQTRTTPAGA